MQSTYVRSFLAEEGAKGGHITGREAVLAARLFDSELANDDVNLLAGCLLARADSAATLGLAARAREMADAIMAAPKLFSADAIDSAKVVSAMGRDVAWFEWFAQVADCTHAAPSDTLPAMKTLCLALKMMPEAGWMVASIVDKREAKRFAQLPRATRQRVRTLCRDLEAAGHMEDVRLA